MGFKKRKEKENTDWITPSIGGLLFLALLSFLIYNGYRGFNMPSPKGQPSPTVDLSDFVNVTALDARRRQWVIQRANIEYCPCGCGYRLAYCLGSDKQCPTRRKNLVRLQELVQESKEIPAKPQQGLP